MIDRPPHDAHVDAGRRHFLVGSALATAAATAGLPRLSFATSSVVDRDVLVVVLLRGGMDGFTLCAPYAESELYAKRPTLAIPPPGQPGGAIDLDGFFGLAPSAAALHAMYSTGDLGFVHAVGLTVPTRSHFEAQRVLEAGYPGAPTGWVARALGDVAALVPNSLRGVALSHVLPFTLQGAPATLPIQDLDGFELPGEPLTRRLRRRTLNRLYRTEPPPLGPATLYTFDTIDALATIDFQNYLPANGAVYPAGKFGNDMRDLAALLKGDVGLEVAQVDFEGWDHHTNAGPRDGRLAQMLEELSRGLAAFHLDLGQRMRRVTVVALSEFGRRLRQNGNLGFDHGAGGCMIVLGGGTLGGRVTTNWPGLAPQQLVDGDLAVTIDYRDVLAEIVDRRMPGVDVAAVFPGFTPTYHGIVA